MKVYQRIAHLLVAIENCRKTENDFWQAQHTANLNSLVKEKLPGGSGFDSGTTLDMDRSSGESLVLHTSFHHMDENGCYDGWTDHCIRVYPDLLFDFRITVSGRDRNGVKEFIADTFHHVLNEDAPE